MLFRSITFVKDHKTGPAVLTIPTKSNETPEPNETLRALRLGDDERTENARTDGTERTDENIRELGTSLDFFVKLREGTSEVEEIENSLNKIKSYCEENNIKLVQVNLLEVCVSNLNFGLMYSSIHSLFIETEITWQFLETLEFEFEKPIKLAHVAEELSQLRCLDP